MYYFGPRSGMDDQYWYDFTEQQHEMAEAIASAVRFADDQAVAASRGEGKSTLAQRLCLKYTLQGMVSFSVLFSATGTMADDSLDAIKKALEENPLLHADYPEVCAPILCCWRTRRTGLIISS